MDKKRFLYRMQCCYSDCISELTPNIQIFCLFSCGACTLIAGTIVLLASWTFKMHHNPRTMEGLLYICDITGYLVVIVGFFVLGIAMIFLMTRFISKTKSTKRDKVVEKLKNSQTSRPNGKQVIEANLSRKEPAGHSLDKEKKSGNVSLQPSIEP